MSDLWLSAIQLNRASRSAWCGDPDTPEAGQVWRARWAASGVLVLLLDVSRSHVLAAPVTSDPTSAGPDTVWLPAAATTIETDLWVWSQLRRELPTRVLDRHLGDLSGPYTGGTTVDPEPPRTSEPGADPLHPSAEERGRLHDEMDALAEAVWAPSGTGQIRELLNAAGVSSDTIRSLPGVRPAEVLGIRRGERPLADPQIEALVALTGIPAPTWWEANPRLPDELVDELDQPHARRQILALAEDEGADELEERRRVAYAIYALAARQTGPPAGTDWAGRLNHYMAARHKP